MKKMRLKGGFILLLFTVLMGFSARAVGDETQLDSVQIVKDVEFVWKTSFTQKEKDRIENLLYSCAYQAQKSLGKYPFKLRFFCTKRNMNGPLGGCRAKFSGPEKGVHLGIDPRYSDSEFMRDWRTHHEISHLALPALGKRNRWFFEGFATYCSRQIMAEANLLSYAEVDSINKARVDAIREDFDQKGTFLEVIIYHQEHWNFSAYYWGGATYFLRADRILKKRYDTSMMEVLREYQLKERNDDRVLLDVIHSWDAIIGDAMFSRLMKEYRTVSAKTVMSRV
jgi:hypothetical protein